jgi:hypothetical protein
MNHTELYFLTISLSLGIGSGAALSQKYGYLGFLGGLFGGFLGGLFGSYAISFTILKIRQKISPRSSKYAKGKKK